MIPVEQTKLHAPANGVIGDCFSATLASLLHLPIEDIPLFAAMDAWQIELNKWLDKYGLTFLLMDYGDGQWIKDCGLSDTYGEVSGPSPRFPDEFHATVGFGGQCIFDPHPEGKGVLAQKYVGYFICKYPWKMVEKATPQP